MTPSSSKKRLVAREKIEPPLQFGKFMLTERIGEGGMAQAFRATTSWAEGVAKEVCVKRILAPLAADERTRAMFIQEARIAASLTHANIVPVYEFGVVEEYYFLAMEYVDGYTVREIMMQATRAKNRLDVPVALHVICEALEGLDYAHRKRDADGQPLQIVHRDVTPGNVMASVEGEVKILDFGIAMLRPAEAQSADPRPQRPAGGLGRGKPGYVSPEQAVGMAVDRRSDIYSVGVLLHEMLSHRRLFKEKTMAARLKRSSEIEPPSVFNPQVDQELDGIVMAALQSKPNDRHATAAAFRDSILDYMHNRGLRAGRAQVAQALAGLFGSARALRSAPGCWEQDVGAIGEAEALPRAPRQTERTQSQRRISTSVGVVTLHSTLRRAGRGRRRRIMLATGAALALAAGVVAFFVWRVGL